MTVTVLYSSMFYKHDPPHGHYHPENSLRMSISLNALRREGFDEHIKVLDTLDNSYYGYLEKVHQKEYVLLVNRLCSTGEGYIDRDTYFNKYTYTVAAHALGCAVYSAELAMRSKDAMVFVLARPPGHHVGSSGRAMGAPSQGFCIFNNVAAAAMYMLDSGLKPVVILDIDVHHGNGTQEIFWTNPNVIHIDIHEYGIYPGTGAVEDLGGGEGYGTKINVPLQPYSRDDDYIYVFQSLVIPIIQDVKPRAIVVSAGFDAYANDGLASMELTEKFYKYSGSVLRALSRELGAGIVSILEGGYGVGLEKGLPAFLKGFRSPLEVETVYNEDGVSQKTRYTVKRLRSLLANVYTL